MQIYLNGEPREIPENPTAAALIESMGLTGKRIAMEVNLGLADSEFNRRELEALGVARTGVLPICLDFDRYREAPSPVLRRLLEDGRTNLLFVGRLVPNKKPEDLIRLASYWKRFVSPDLRVVLVGKLPRRRAYFDALQALAYEEGFTPEEVVFTGHVAHDDLLACYAAARVFVSMSEYEGFGVPLVESMLMRVAVLAHAATAVPFTLGGAGVQFGEKRIAEVAETARALATDEPLRERVLLGQDRRLGVQQACQALGISRASYYRRERQAPKAPTAPASPTPRALTPAERQTVRETLYSERFLDQTPRQIYATLLDEGQYLCSVRTMYRLLEQEQAVRERRDQLRHPHYQKPELLATAPNQVWSWDITKLLGPQKWTYYYLYVILDIYSRYVVGWMLAHRECQDLAARLIRDSVQRQQVGPQELTIHSDRGPSMTSQTVAQLLGSLAVTQSHSRPHVSNDNPFSESQFKTLKYTPEFPERFASYEHALSFCRGFFPWYNDEHYHSGIGLLTPAILHYGRAPQVLQTRQAGPYQYSAQWFVVSGQ